MAPKWSTTFSQISTLESTSTLTRRLRKVYPKFKYQNHWKKSIKSSSINFFDMEYFKILFKTKYTLICFEKSMDSMTISSNSISSQIKDISVYFRRKIMIEKNSFLSIQFEFLFCGRHNSIMDSGSILEIRNFQWKL